MGVSPGLKVSKKHTVEGAGGGRREGRRGNGSAASAPSPGRSPPGWDFPRDSGTFSLARPRDFLSERMEEAGGQILSVLTHLSGRALRSASSPPWAELQPQK